MKIYAIGDLHLSFDEAVEKPMDIFGQGWLNHDEKVKNSWKKQVGEDDIVMIAGDISWGLRLEEAVADLTWISQLPGMKVLIKGNHDLWWSSISKLNKFHETMKFLQNTSFVTEDGIGICGSRGWNCPGSEAFDHHDEKIYARELLRLESSLKSARDAGAKQLIAMLHYPPTNDKHQPSGFTELLSAYGVTKCVYGHLHGKDSFKKGLQGSFNGVEYRLVSLDYLDGQLRRII